MSTNILPLFSKPISADSFVVGAVAVQTAEFIGSGLDDATAAGTASGVGSVIEVEIDAEGTPDTFKWRVNGGSYTTDVSITGAAQMLSAGATITFTATTGHSLGDKWVIRVCGNQVALKRCVVKIIQVANVDGTNAAEFTAVNAKDGQALIFTHDIAADTSVTFNFGDGVDMQGLLLTAEAASDLVATITGGVSQQTDNVIF